LIHATTPLASTLGDPGQMESHAVGQGSVYASSGLNHLATAAHGPAIFFQCAAARLMSWDRARSGVSSHRGSTRYASTGKAPARRGWMGWVVSRRYAPDRHPLARRSRGHGEPVAGPYFSSHRVGTVNSNDIRVEPKSLLAVCLGNRSSLPSKNEGALSRRSGGQGWPGPVRHPCDRFLSGSRVGRGRDLDLCIP